MSSVWKGQKEYFCEFLLYDRNRTRPTPPPDPPPNYAILPPPPDSPQGGSVWVLVFSIPMKRQKTRPLERVSPVARDNYCTYVCGPSVQLKLCAFGDFHVAFPSMYDLLMLFYPTIPRSHRVVGSGCTYCTSHNGKCNRCGTTCRLRPGQEGSHF